MMRKFGKFTGQMRALAFEFRQGIDELGRQAELDELRKEVASLKEATGVEDLQRDLQQDQIAFQQEVTATHALPSPAEAAEHAAQDVAEIQPAEGAEDAAIQVPEEQLYRGGRCLRGGSL